MDDFVELGLDVVHDLVDDGLGVAVVGDDDSGEGGEGDEDGDECADDGVGPFEAEATVVVVVDHGFHAACAGDDAVEVDVGGAEDYVAYFVELAVDFLAVSVGGGGKVVEFGFDAGVGFEGFVFGEDLFGGDDGGVDFPGVVFEGGFDYAKFVADFDVFFVAVVAHGVDCTVR